MVRGLVAAIVVDAVADGGLMSGESVCADATAVAEFVSGKSPKAANWVAAEEAGVVDGRLVAVAVAVNASLVVLPATAAFKACIKGSAALADAVAGAFCESCKPWVDAGINVLRPAGRATP